MSSEASERRPPAWMWLLACPPLAIVCGAAILIVLGAIDRNPFWPRQQMTMAEAAALRDPGTVAWMIEEGVDPNRPMHVRAGVLGDGPQTLTPAEAAILADRTEVLGTLLGRGVRVSADGVRQWVCLARTAGADESLTYLQSAYPEWTQGSCDRVSLP